MQNERNPGYTAPPADADLLKSPQSAGAPAVASPLFNFTPAKTLVFAAGLLLVLYALWPLLRPLWTPASHGALPGGENQPASQVSAGVAPGGISGEAVLERITPGSAAAVQAESLTPPTRGLSEEDSAPPLPGLLMPPPPTLDNVSYTGPSQNSAELAKETSGDRADCKTGDMFKCLRLGWRYNTGYGVKKNIVRGFTLINKACAGGVAEACTSQGILQSTGHGTAKNESAAVALFDKACAAGDMYGCTMLGSNYIDGAYVPQDISRGLGLFAKACDAKLAQACSLLGTIYAEGKLAPRDTAAADLLLGKACGLQNKNACQLQQQLEAHAAAEKKF